MADNAPENQPTNTSSGHPTPESAHELPDLSGGDPQETLDHIRQKMESVAAEFSQGKINRAQFDAIYGHYNEQRTIIERLVKRNPENDTWKQVARPGRTTFLRSHFEAQALYYVIFRHNERKPLSSAGQQPKNIITPVVTILKQLWSVNPMPPAGLGRKALDDGMWMVLAFGANAATIVIYSMQPSAQQLSVVKDTHSDFERANRLTLQRSLGPEMMVFPQRGLIRERG